MTRDTRYYKKKLSVTEVQQIEELPRLSFVRVLNYGPEEVYLEFENNIDENSIILPIKGDIKIPADMLDLRYKSVTGTSTLYIYGLKHNR